MKWTAFLVLTVLLASCIESKRHYLLNPDGSGKVMVEVKMSSMKSGDEALKTTVKEMLQNSAGVEVWTDVDVRALEDGRIQFRGTAYFQNIQDVQIKNADDFKVRMEEVDQTTRRISILNKDSKKKQSTKRDDLTIEGQRAKYNQMKPMLTAFLAGMKSTLIIETGGKIQKVSNLKKEAGDRLVLEFAGEKMMATLDQLMADDAWLKEQIQAGHDIESSSPSGNRMNERLFGENGPIEATIQGLKKNTFDYPREVKFAKTHYESMLTRIGMTSLIPVRIARGGDFKSLKIAKVSLSDIQDDGYVHFGTSQKYQLTLLGELPGSVLKITKGELRTAVADNGEDLMPESDWDREINWPQLSQGKNFVQFDVHLKLPSASANGIEEVSGILRYVVGTKTKIVESPVAFQPNADGPNGIKIEAVEQQGDDSVLRFELSGPTHLVKTISFRDAQGKPFAAQQQSWSGSDDKIWYAYVADRNWPPSGTIVMEMVDDVQEYELPFRIGPANLLGR